MSKNRITLFALLGFGAIAIIVLLVGGSIAGWDIIGWFKSDDAIWAYVLIAIYVLIILELSIQEWTHKL